MAHRLLLLSRDNSLNPFLDHQPLVHKGANMATKQAARKTPAKKKATTASKKSVSTRKATAKKKVERHSTKAATKSVKAPRAKRSKAPSRKSRTQRRSPAAALRLKPNERLEKLTVEIEKPKSGDVIVTESLGGSIRVHHTVHPESVATPIPGKTYNDLKRLTPGTHNITVKRSLEPANPVASGSPS
jgi:hypothetical protein